MTVFMSGFPLLRTELHPVDWAILGLYVVGLFVIAALLARKAGRGDEDYFLGGRRLPWWALGASGMSSNLDVAGTAVIITLIYHYGLHGFFIEFRGGVVLPIAVWLAFMGKWHRRSKVTTTAQWMNLRFGDGPGGQAARFTAAMTYLVITVGMVVFFLSAAGIFIAEFWPGTPRVAEIAAATGAEADRLAGVRNDHIFWINVAVAGGALVYTAVAGLYGVVWTDVFQAFIIGAAAIYTGVVAFTLVTPELLAAWPGAAFNVAFPKLYDAGLDLSDRGQQDYSLFVLFFVFFAGKGVLEGLGGSGGSAYMAQRYYAARSDAETRRLSMLWAALFAFRWPLVLGLTIMAISLGVGLGEAGVDEVGVLLPTVLKSDFFPVGMTGLMIAALVAASMSTFDSTINAGASYVVKDLYVPLQPYASPRAQVVAGYASSLGIVALGLVLSILFPAGVLEVWGAIVVLFSAFLVPFALRWFWPRMNGWGFTAGTAAGFGALSLVMGPIPGLIGGGWQQWAANLNEAAQLGVGAGASLAGTILGTYLTRPVEESTLRVFYRQIRPIGWWPAAWRRNDVTEHRADGLRLGVALLWQVFTFLLPMLAMLQMWVSFAAVGIPWVFLTVALWRDAKSAPGDEKPERASGVRG